VDLVICVASFMNKSFKAKRSRKSLLYEIHELMKCTFPSPVVQGTAVFTLFEWKPIHL